MPISVKLQSVSPDAVPVVVATGFEVFNGIELLEKTVISYASACTQGYWRTRTAAPRRAIVLPGEIVYGHVASLMLIWAMVIS